MTDTHLINGPGERRSLCDIQDPLPVMCAFAVPLHRVHRRLNICPACLAAVPAVPWRNPHLDDADNQLIDWWLDARTAA